MNIYLEASILQVSFYAGCQFYAHTIVREMARLAPEHTFHLHLAMGGWHPKIDELTAMPNVVPHVATGPLGRHVGLPLNILRTRSRVLYILNGNTGKLRLPVPCPTAVLFHDMRNVLCGEIYGKEFCAAFDRECRKWVFRRDCIVTGSDTVKGEIVRHFGVAPERVVVASEAAGHRDGHSESVRPKSLPAGDYPIFLMVNPGEVRKNWQDVLEAYDIYLRRHPEDADSRLVLAGNLRAEADGVGKRLSAPGPLAARTVLLGYVADEELEYLYRRSRFSIYPSRYEGFGIPILESMARDLPVIVSDIPVFREVAGDAGHFVPLDRPDAMATAMRQLHTDDALRRDLVGKGRSRVDSYSWERSARITLTALTALALRQPLGGAG